MATKPKLATYKKNSKVVACTGGPWHERDVLLPQQCKGDELSLPVRVGEHVGQYNLNTGAWVPMETKV